MGRSAGQSGPFDRCGARSSIRTSTMCFACTGGAATSSMIPPCQELRHKQARPDGAAKRPSACNPLRGGLCADDGAPMTSPLAAYSARLAAGDLQADLDQARAAQRLDALAQDLARWRPDAWVKKGAWIKKGAWFKPGAPPRGLYLYGP